MIKREEYMGRIRPFIETDLIKVLTGIRRSGKSIMLQLIKQEILEKGIDESQIFYYNFEDMSNIHLADAQALNDEITQKIGGINKKAFLFFDEIQEVQGWEKAINSFRVAYDCDIYITGSNAKLLSGELATYLAGRYVEFVIYPFSFQEFELLYSSVFPEVDQRGVFQEFILRGGMPYLSNLRYAETPSKLYLQDLFNSVILKDIVKRNNIRDVDLLERIIAYITAHVGTTFSANSISKYLKSEGRSVSAETVLNYIKFCEDAFLFYRVKRQDIKGKKILSVQEKYYIADHGIREAVYGGNERDINLILENIVFMELLRRGYEVTVGKFEEKEIDFIGEKQSEKVYVQVSYLLASPETIQREFGAFDGIEDNYPKYVVSFDEFDFGRKGIIHENIRNFLLLDKY